MSVGCVVAGAVAAAGALLADRFLPAQPPAHPADVVEPSLGDSWLTTAGIEEPVA